MTARILVVDDTPANVKFLEARLTAEYFDVRTATNGVDALRIAGAGGCDMLLLDVMMPGLDGFETCRRLKADPATSHLPVVLITALDQAAARLCGLEAGADDFLTKPVDEITLLARVRSLARLKVMVDELRSRAASSARAGLRQALPLLSDDEGSGGRIFLVDDRESSFERIVKTLSAHHAVTVETDPQDAIFKGVGGGFDLIVVNGMLRDYDGLRLCGQFRSLERTRQIPILLLAQVGDRPQVVRAFDLGVNDYLTQPVDRDELLARVRIQLRKKRYADRLQQMLDQSIQLAVIDPLTGLNNRRFLETNLQMMMEAAVDGNRTLSLMILDIDHFKAVNDTYGHDVGDAVLKIFANRLRGVIRGIDLLCRLGGEEFIVVMPDTAIDVAKRVGERIRQAVNASPFSMPDGGHEIPVTVSIGIAERRQDRQSEPLMKRADKALYLSKSNGRNQVSADAA